MTHLWLVRHGPTHEKVFTGWRDVPADLSDSDRIGRLSRHLPAPARLISSDLIRARDTASSLSANRNRLPDDPDLREFDFGEWDGRHWSDVARTDPDLSRRYWENPGDAAPPGGESWNAAAARVSRAVDQLIARHAGRHIIVVVHFGAILTQLQRALGTSAAETLAHRIDPLSVTDIRISPNSWQVGQINHIP